MHTFKYGPNKKVHMNNCSYVHDIKFMKFVNPIFYFSTDSVSKSIKFTALIIQKKIMNTASL